MIVSVSFYVEDRERETQTEVQSGRGNDGKSEREIAYFSRRCIPLPLHNSHCPHSQKKMGERKEKKRKEKKKRKGRKEGKKGKERKGKERKDEIKKSHHRAHIRALLPREPRSGGVQPMPGNQMPPYALTPFIASNTPQGILFFF